MNWFRSLRKLGQTLLGASLLLGLAPVSDALAESPYRPLYQCPPGYRHSAPAPYYSVPGQPGAVPPGAMPSETIQPGTQQPGQSDQSTSPPPDATQQGQPQDQSQQPIDFSQSADSSRASPSPGMNTPQLGRLDQANRLNLFDNMVAAPQNRVWFGYQYSSGITTGIGPSSSFVSFFNGLSSFEQGVYSDALSGFVAQQRQNNYRAGAEVLITPDLSVSVQGQYFTNSTDGEFGDDWSNPQIMLKQVLARDCNSVLSATLGITPQTSVQQGALNENTTKLYPGMLYYEMLGPNLFTQGGFQFGIPTREDQIYTFDWSLSLGYWLYRDCNLNCCNSCCSHSCASGRITGIIPQVNFLGKHTLGDGTRFNAFGIPTAVSGFDPDGLGGVPSFTGNLAIYNEPRDVIDLSVGTLVMVGCDVQVGLGYSFPISSIETRDSEFLSYVNYLF